MTDKWVDFQSPLAGDMKRFLLHKRGLARQFCTEENVLRLLDRYLIEQRVAHITAITPSLLDDFFASRPRTRPRSYNHLLGVTRQFFCWLVEQGIISSSPVHASRRRAITQRFPFLFDVIKARKLLEISSSLLDNSRASLRGPTYTTIFALLYGLGLRVGEVSRLCRKDVDFDRHLLVIRQTKFGKSRFVPFGPRMGQRLSEYMRLREQQSGALHPDAPIFSFTKNKPIHPGTISLTFHHLLPRLNLDVLSGTAPPRLHDLRHSFAVATLLRWYRTGADPSKRLIHLSTFLGHVNPESTAVYLTITTDLLQEANQRFERFAGPLLKEVIL